MIWYKADDGLREVVDGGKDIDEGEDAQHQKLIPIEIAALVQELVNVHGEFMGQLNRRTTIVFDNNRYITRRVKNKGVHRHFTTAPASTTVCSE